MSNQRTHQVTTNDGVVIGGTVHGEGPPIVFVQGVIGDGDLDWQSLLPHLTDRFTCYLPSLRGRGLSGDHPDVRPGRMVDDVLAYVDSIGEPTGLVGWSLSADLSLVVAARSAAVAAVAPIEPVMPRLLSEQEYAAVGSAVARMGELAADGEFAAAARAFATWPLQDGEIAAAEEAGYFEAQDATCRASSTSSSSSRRVRTTPLTSRQPTSRLCSARFQRRRWCCTDRTPGPSSPPAPARG